MYKIYIVHLFLKKIAEAIFEKMKKNCIFFMAIPLF